jgi:quercetin dioxygenase-like cupin family protein
MITSIHSYSGVTATVYVMNRGEKIVRHQHAFVHTTSVAAGRSEVEVYRWPNSSEAFEMRPDQPRVELPAGIDHEIRALEDGTVVVNMAVWTAAAATAAPAEPAAAGGVALHDGTVVNAA